MVQRFTDSFYIFPIRRLVSQESQELTFILTVNSLATFIVIFLQELFSPVNHILFARKCFDKEMYNRKLPNLGRIFLERKPLEGCYNNLWWIWESLLKSLSQTVPLFLWHYNSFGTTIRFYRAVKRHTNIWQEVVAVVLIFTKAFILLAKSRDHEFLFFLPSLSFAQLL